MLISHVDYGDCIDADKVFLAEREYEVRLSRLDEIRQAALTTLQHKQEKSAMINPRWMHPEEGELVRLRRDRLDTQKSKKLEPRWLGPFLLKTMSKNRRSAMLWTVDTGLEVGVHHVNKMAVYFPSSWSDWRTQMENSQATEQY